MFIFSFFVSFRAFPYKKDALLKSEPRSNIIIESSGSIGHFYGGKCRETFPNQTIIGKVEHDWCSNIGKFDSDKPWIQYSLKDKKISVSGYSIRNGCCVAACCCINDDENIDEVCCCTLYSYSLQGSNDNKTWTTLHKVEKDPYFYGCETKTFELHKKSEEFTFIRFTLDEQRPGCLNCMQLNQVELYGNTAIHSTYIESNDEDESISIIGRVKKDE